MNWRSKFEKLSETTTRVTITDLSGQPLSFQNWFEQIASDAKFGFWFTDQLVNINGTRFHWELPQLTTHTIDQDFECAVVVNDSFIRMKPDPYTFANQFNQSQPEYSVIGFPNLSADAYLLAPLPLSGETDCYTHLAIFLSEAPRQQVAEFWQKVGAIALERLSDVPYWLSTAGMGVAWLHLRFDSQPKYYRHEAYQG